MEAAASCQLLSLLRFVAIPQFRVRTVSLNFRRLDLDRVARYVTTVIDKRTRVRPEPWGRPSTVASPESIYPMGTHVRCYR